jgi:hypothetical protein
MRFEIDVTEGVVLNVEKSTNILLNLLIDYVSNFMQFKYNQIKLQR